MSTLLPSLLWHSEFPIFVGWRVVLTGILAIWLEIRIHISSRTGWMTFLKLKLLECQSDYIYPVASIDPLPCCDSDAFVLNIGSDPWQSARVADAYTAAQQSNTSFKLFISFDMSVLPCASSSDAGAIRQYITTYANHPAQFTYNGKPFASTFSGSSCTFGAGSVATGWQSVFAGTPVQFVPSFFMDPTQFSTLGNIMNGALNVRYYPCCACPIPRMVNSLVYLYL
jgi:Glycosyl hydrolase family 71